MPKTRITLPDGIDHISILDETGRLDASLEPKIDPEVLRRLYRVMLLARRFDERLLSLQRQGRIGTFPPIAGQEAAHLGAAAVLKPDDWMVPAFREMAADIWRGRPLDSIIVYNNGFSEGGRVPADRNDMPIAIPVGSQILHAVGIAWGMKYRNTRQVAMAFFGDGATSQGDFHEGLNYAGVFELPVVFVCQNNQWAISIPRTRQTRSTTLAQKAHAYGIAGRAGGRQRHPGGLRRGRRGGRPRARGRRPDPDRVRDLPSWPCTPRPTTPSATAARRRSSPGAAGTRSRVSRATWRPRAC